MSSTILSSKFKTAAMVEGVISHAFCIAKALLETNTKASSKDKAPFATNAENSPNECPATISGSKSSNVLAKITECKKTAGCVTLVSFNSSAVPSNIISVIRKPKISFALSNSSLATAEFSYKSLPIPVNCAPCPGKTYAFIFFSLKVYVFKSLRDYQKLKTENKSTYFVTISSN